MPPFFEPSHLPTLTSAADTQVCPSSRSSYKKCTEVSKSSRGSNCTKVFEWVHIGSNITKISGYFSGMYIKSCPVTINCTIVSRPINASSLKKMPQDPAVPSSIHNNSAYTSSNNSILLTSETLKNTLCKKVSNSNCKLINMTEPSLKNLTANNSYYLADATIIVNCSHTFLCLPIIQSCDLNTPAGSFTNHSARMLLEVEPESQVEAESEGKLQLEDKLQIESSRQAGKIKLAGGAETLTPLPEESELKETIERAKFLLLETSMKVLQEISQRDSQVADLPEATEEAGRFKGKLQDYFNPNNFNTDDPSVEQLGSTSASTDFDND